MKFLKAIEKKFEGSVSVFLPIVFVFLNAAVIQNRWMNINNKSVFFKIALDLVLTAAVFFLAKFFSAVNTPTFEGAPDVHGEKKVSKVSKFVKCVAFAALVLNTWLVFS